VDADSMLIGTNTGKYAFAANDLSPWMRRSSAGSSALASRGFLRRWKKGWAATKRNGPCPKATADARPKTNRKNGAVPLPGEMKEKPGYGAFSACRTLPHTENT